MNQNINHCVQMEILLVLFLWKEAKLNQLFVSDMGLQILEAVN